MAETDGQASSGPETTQTGTETTTTAPESKTDAQTTTPGPAAEETFFDPESIKGKPELELAYKQMQGQFTKRTTALKQSEQKVQAYDMFLANPERAMQDLAAQFGFKLTKAEAKAMAAGQFEPQSWDEVINKAKLEARDEVLKELSPFITQVKETRQEQVAKLLDENCPDWRLYEDKMTEKLQKHPTLVNDPEELYRISVPTEVWLSRATQAALKKLQDKASSSQLSGGSSTTQAAADKPKGKMTFNESVKWAKAKLAAEGKLPH